jgi:hypothetical protein
MAKLHGVIRFFIGTALRPLVTAPGAYAGRRTRLQDFPSESAVQPTLLGQRVRSRRSRVVFTARDGADARAASRYCAASSA